jgi:uncharacterized protein (DUF1778 family)
MNAQPQHRTRPKQLVVQVTDAERDLFHEAAKASGLPMQAWVRSLLAREAYVVIGSRREADAVRSERKSAARALLDGE